MSQRINIYAAKVTPKQKKDLLGIYQDYLYFTQGLELVLKNNTSDSLAYMFIKKVGWDKELFQDLPWHFAWADDKEQEEYIRFTQGIKPDSEKYTYMSLYHTKAEDDVAYAKISSFPETYTLANIDLDLPCLVERYAAAFPKDQKMKDAVFLIDGLFRVEYRGTEFADSSVSDGLNNYQVQDGFRVLLNLTDHYNRHKYEIEYRSDDPIKQMMGTMKKIMATEALSSFENKVLELLGSYSDKTQEMLRLIFPGKTSQELLSSAKAENLINSAETMQSYMNIRHLLRHQWDMLDKTGRFALGGNEKNEQLRKEYLQSYHQIFDKTLSERLKIYQKIAVDMQTFLKVFYPEFLTREVGESNSKFVQRLKEWQKQNPNINPLINMNYPVKSDKRASLAGNIAKVIPQAEILDNMRDNDLEKFSELENAYFRRSWFLSLYDHIESDMKDHCFMHGQALSRIELWDYFKKKVFSPQEYNTWKHYRQLRNDLSHNHLDADLRQTLDNVVKGSFGEDCYNLSQFIIQNRPEFSRQDDGTYLVTQKDGSVIHIDFENRQILGRVNKNGDNLLTGSKNKAEAKACASECPVKLFWKEGKIVNCKLANGIDIDMARKKVYFPDDARLYLDAEKYNVFRFVNNNKLFTDKNFVVTNYLENGRKIFFGRNDTSIVAPKHKIKTDNRNRVAEDSIIISEDKKLLTRFSFEDKNPKIIFSDGTILKVGSEVFEVSHNGVVLDYNHRHMFIQSYTAQQPQIQKSGFER